MLKAFFKKIFAITVTACLYHVKQMYLTLNLLEAKGFVFATSIEPGQLAHLCNLTRHYTVGWPSSSSHLDILKNGNESSKNRRWIIHYKEFSRLRVKTTM